MDNEKAPSKTSRNLRASELISTGGLAQRDKGILLIFSILSEATAVLIIVIEWQTTLTKTAYETRSIFDQTQMRQY